MAFFGARSLLDGIDDEEVDPQTQAFIGKLIEYFLTNPTAKDNFIVAKSVILFVDQAAKVLLHQQNSSAIITYLFDIFTRHEKLQTKALETLLEYSLYCK